MEKCNPFEVQIEAILDSMRFTMSIGVWRLDDVRRATATNAKMASMSSCVCPTCRWWHEATPHRPDCAMHPSILCPCWFRISLTVLSLCNQSLGLRLNMVMVEGRIKIKWCFTNHWTKLLFGEGRISSTSSDPSTLQRSHDLKPPQRRTRIKKHTFKPSWAYV